MSYKRIMVAVDGSESSELALNEAIMLTKDLHAQICILHITDVIPIYNRTYVAYGVDLTEHEESIKKASLTILDKMAQKVREEGITPEIQNVVIVEDIDSIPEKIVAHANDWHADLLVLGTHGRRGVRRMLLGSVAEEVVRNITRPVLLVHSDV
jgi:nucleotide-binding universal stress UspA family protein